MELVVGLLIGLAGGIAGGLLGIGGGTLFVPAMVLILGTDQHVAQGVSLVVIVPTALSATQANLRAGFVDMDVSKWVTPFAIALAFGGAFVAGMLDGDVLSRIFGLIVIYVGGRTLVTTALAIRRERALVRGGDGVARTP